MSWEPKAEILQECLNVINVSFVSDNEKQREVLNVRLIQLFDSGWTIFVKFKIFWIIMLLFSVQKQWR